MANRSEVTFLSAGARCAAWLYLPDGEEPAPVVVMGHGLGAIRQMRLDAYAERFAEQGYACLVFDYRHFGGSEGEPRQLLDIGRQLEDWSAAVDYARGRPGLDGQRVVLWGTSFGGGHAIATAAREANIAAVIAQCPFTDGLASALAMDPRTSLKVTVRAVRDVIASKLGRRPVMIATSGPPGSTALMSAPDAQPGYLALVPSGAPFRNEVCARIGLQILRYFPGRSAANVTCSILFAICESDSVAPARATQRHARNAPRAEIRLYPEGHFDIYVGAPFERVIADQIAFLHKHVPTGSKENHDGSL